MSRTRYDWWGYVKGMIRRYPRLRDAEVSGVALCEKRAVEAAVAYTARMENGAERLKVVDLVLWQGSHTLAGAALMVPCSERTARRYHTDFIKLVAKSFECRGLLDKSWP